MKNHYKILSYNLLILLSIGILLGIFSDDFGFAIIYAFTIAISTISNLIISLVFVLSEGEDKEKAKYFLLSAGLILLIGFSSCYAIASIK